MICCYFAALVFVLWFLLIASYCIPQKWVYDNSLESVDVLEKEGLYLSSSVSGGG